jgi:predicted nucleic acid-binding protein
LSEERPRRLVLDASVVIKGFLNESLSDRATALLAGGEEPDRLALDAPDLLYVECANILWKHVRRGVLDRALAAEHASSVAALRLRSTPAQELTPTALALAIEHDISAYDASYVALAQSLACELVTADERLVNKLAPRLGFVRWLGDPAFAFGDEA